MSRPPAHPAYDRGSPPPATSDLATATGSVPGKSMSELQQGLQAIVSLPANAPVILRFKRFFYGLLIVPIAVYAAVFNVLVWCVDNRVFNISTLSKLASPSLIAGIAAVATVNLLTGLFVLGALNEPPTLPQSAGTADDVVNAADNNDEAVADNSYVDEINAVSDTVAPRRRPRRRPSAD
jgi:hypothetical protein